MTFKIIDDFDFQDLKNTLIENDYFVDHEDADRMILRSPDGTWLFGVERELFSSDPFDPQNEAWLFNVFSSYDPSKAFYSQDSGLNSPARSYTTSLPFSKTRRAKAFLSITAQRIIIVVRFGGLYFSFYVGKMNSFDSGSNYAEPFILSGPAGYALENFSPSYRHNDFNSVGSISGNSTSYFKDSEGIWQRIKSDQVNSPQRPGSYAITPFLESTEDLTMNLDGTSTMIPSVVVGNGYFHGELDIFRVSGPDVSAENTFISGDETFICFPIFSSSDSENGEHFAFKIN